MDNESSPKSTQRRNPLAARAHERGTNLILALLPAADRRRIAGNCEKVSLDIETVLYEAGGVLGAERSHVKALIQVKGEFLRMRRKDFMAELKNDGPFARLVQRFSQTLTTQISQSILCNCAHSMEQRICRWLLMTHDRAGADQMKLTQHFIAQMLGVRRPSVTVAAGLLQKAGFIKYSRGSVTVLDRAGLEDASCECYAIVNKELDVLMHG